MKTKILYIGNFSFPLGNAAGKRVYSNGKIFKHLGYDVIFVGLDNQINTVSLNKSRRNWDGFEYFNFSTPVSLYDWLKYKSIFKELVIFLRKTNIIEEMAFVIYYGSPRISLFNSLLIDYFKSKNIKVVSDCVDWLSVRTNNLFFDISKNLDSAYQKMYANNQTDGVIAVSNFLANYYKNHGLPTVTIPPLSPIKYSLPKEGRDNSGRKIITYAGIPFRKGQRINALCSLKDRVDKVIMLLHQSKIEGCDFLFNIFGFTQDEYLQAFPNHTFYLEELGESLIFYGFKKNEEITKKIMASDFTILLRDVNRSTSAGFPTKVSESISCGTPVITNKTSDLDEFIFEGENGFFLDIDNFENSTSQLKYILGLPFEKIERMKNFCINSDTFYYERYLSKMRGFLDTLLN